MIKYKIEPIEAINKLPERLREVLEMRLGIGKYKKRHTTLEISELMKNQCTGGFISRTRVQQLEKKALRMLKDPIMNCNVIIV